MEIKNLSEKVRQAKEAVEALDEPLKTEAFKKILDKLLETEVKAVPASLPIVDGFETVPEKRKIVVKRKLTGSRKVNKFNARVKEEVEQRKKKLAEMLNRTEYSEIHDFTKVLPRALYVLKIMRDKDVDGLTASEMAYILTEVFRIKTSNEAVGVSLRDAHRYVDRGKTIVGKTIAYVYRIMKNGEDYLDREMRNFNNHIAKTEDGREPDSS